MKKRTVVIWAGIVSIVLLGFLSAALSLAHGLAFAVTMALSVMAMLFSLFAIPFFLRGVKQFSASLRHAYFMLYVGIGMFGIAQIQLPLVSEFNLGWWINSGSVAVPYLVGVIGIFWGIRRFASLLNTQTRWMSIGWVLLTTLVVVTIAIILPHVQTGQDNLTFDISLALSVANSVIITFAAIATFGIRLKIGKVYTHSMNWLSAALAVLSFAGWHYTIVQMTLTTGDWYYDFSFNIIPFVLSAFLFVIAGYAFDTIDLFSTAAVEVNSSSRVELDVVLYVASLVSRPADIDVILDIARDLTSHLEAGQPLTSLDRQKLIEVYKKLEVYLAKQDPLYTMTPIQLRKTVFERFGWSPGESTSI